MVDPFQLTADIVETSVAVATPGLLWLFLFLLAWEDPSTARAIGFGRRTFWLLLPGAIVGAFVNLPFFAWSGDLLAVNLGGGLLPLVVSLVTLRRVFPRTEPYLYLTLVGFAAASWVQLSLVWTVPEGTLLDLLVLAVALAAPLALALAAAGESSAFRSGLRHAALLLAFSEAAVVLTFLTTQTVPGLGIVSQFPAYLLAPLLLGALAGVVTPLVTDRGSVAGLAVAYATVTFGVLVGADLLRQPPLYAPGSTAIYAIGGAGTNDLLYLSGLLALGAAYLVVRLLRRTRGTQFAAPAPPAAGPATSGQLLRRSLLDAVEGRAEASVRTADGAVSTAFGQTRELLELPRAPSSARELDGLPVAAWVAADRQNLAALARREGLAPHDATRAWMTARWLVRFARLLGLRRFAGRRVRSIAYLVDLAILTVPAVLVWYYLAAVIPGSINDLLSSVALNGSLFAYVALALLLFVLGEASWGQTPGKRLLGLRVTDRHLRPPGPIASLLRNLPKVVTISVVGYVGLFAAVFSERGTSFSVQSSLLNAVVTLVLIVFVLVLGLGIPGGISVATIGASPERQRLGDLWAGTWVVRATPTASAAPAPGAPKFA